jgi:hypothetical protein
VQKRVPIEEKEEKEEEEVLQLLNTISDCNVLLIGVCVYTLYSLLRHE